MSNGTALAGIRVVELGDLVSAPFTGKLLADLGAEVVKVEPPEGDSARRQGPFPDDVPHPEQSGLFLFFNTNKLGVTLDPEHGMALLRELLATSDVLVHDRSAAEARLLGLTYDALKGLNPRLVVTAVTPYGQSGPYAEYRGHDLTAGALGGINWVIGHPAREPLGFAGFQTDQFGGLCASIATMFAIFARRKTGRGQDVDVAQADCWATFLTGMGLSDWINEGRIKRRSGHRAEHRPFIDCLLPCKDGYFTLDTPQRKQWKRFLEMIGSPKWGEDPRFAVGQDVADYYIDEVEGLIQPYLLDRTKAELFDLIRTFRVPGAPCLTMAEVAEHPQLVERECFVEVDHPEAGRVKMPGAPYKLSGTPWAVRAPAPRLGEHNDLVFCTWLGHERAELVEWRRARII